MMLPSISFTALVSALSLKFQNAAPASTRLLSDIETSYIVKLRDGTNITSHINSLPFLFSVEDANSPVTHWWPDDFKGYSGVFEGAALDAILASPDVEYVEENGHVSASNAQTNVRWNLQSISTDVSVGGTDVNATSYTYSYTQPVGAGVDIYIADTGVYLEHSEFEGRATFGWAGRNFAEVDRNGHGTHVAGIAAGKTYGVAKDADIIAVKVLDDSGGGNIANIVGGINWIAANVRSTRKPSIACLAFNSRDGLYAAIDDAVTTLIANNVTVVVAAGNYAIDSAGSSPSSVEEAIVVGASDIKNSIYRKSNFGKDIDVFAPGVSITSAGINGTNSTSIYSGTSMAAAHVTGIAAYFLSQNTTMNPAAISSKIWTLATKGVVSGAPSGTLKDLVFNGFSP